MSAFGSFVTIDRAASFIIDTTGRGHDIDAFRCLCNPAIWLANKRLVTLRYHYSGNSSPIMVLNRISK